MKITIKTRNILETFLFRIVLATAIIAGGLLFITTYQKLVSLFGNTNILALIPFAIILIVIIVVFVVLIILLYPEVIPDDK